MIFHVYFFESLGSMPIAMPVSLLPKVGVGNVNFDCILHRMAFRYMPRNHLQSLWYLMFYGFLEKNYVSTLTLNPAVSRIWDAWQVRVENNESRCRLWCMDDMFMLQFMIIDVCVAIMKKLLLIPTSTIATPDGSSFCRSLPGHPDGWNDAGSSQSKCRKQWSGSAKQYKDINRPFTTSIGDDFLTRTY